MLCSTAGRQWALRLSRSETLTRAKSHTGKQAASMMSLLLSSCRAHQKEATEQAM